MLKEGPLKRQLEKLLKMSFLQGSESFLSTVRSLNDTLSNWNINPTALAFVEPSS
jgi:hypothetical protein